MCPLFLYISGTRHKEEVLKHLARFESAKLGTWDRRNFPGSTAEISAVVS